MVLFRVVGCLVGGVFACFSVRLEPVEDSGIEVLHRLPVESVASVVVKMRFAVGKGFGNLFAHPEWGEDVVSATCDEARVGDVAQLIVDVVVDAGRGLTPESLERLRVLGCCGVVSSVEKALIAFVIVPERLGENEKLDPLHEVGGTKRGFAVAHVLEDGLGVAVAARPRAHKDSGLHSLGVSQHELLGDDTAHGDSDDAGFFNAESIHETYIVVSEHLRGVVAGGLVALSDSAVVGHDTAEAGTPGFGMGFPDSSGSSDPHDHDERIAGALLLVVHSDAVGR